jgi:hypothetical protein
VYGHALRINHGLEAWYRSPALAAAATWVQACRRGRPERAPCIGAGLTQ